MEDFSTTSSSATQPLHLKVSDTTEGVERSGLRCDFLTCRGNIIHLETTATARPAHQCSDRVAGKPGPTALWCAALAVPIFTAGSTVGATCHTLRQPYRTSPVRRMADEDSRGVGEIRMEPPVRSAHMRGNAFCAVEFDESEAAAAETGPRDPAP